MSSRLADVWKAERSDGLRRLTGSRVSGIVPIRQEVIDLLLARWRPPAVLDAVRVRLLPPQHLHVSASVLAFGFRKQIDATLKMPPAVDFRQRPTVHLQFVERSALAFAASLMAPLLGGLPAGISMSESQVNIDLQELFSRVGAAEWLPHLKALSFDSEHGVVWLNVAIEIAPPNPEVPHPVQVATHQASRIAPVPGELIPLFAGTRLGVEVRAHQSLVTETAAAVLADAAQRAEGPPTTDAAAITRFFAPPRIRFEPETMVLETEVRVDPDTGLA